MAGLSLYEVTVPRYIKGLNMLNGILTKAEEHAKEKGVDADAEYAGARLVEDMFPLTLQVALASDFAKRAIARISGEEFPVWENKETTFAELHARVDKTLALLKGVGAAAIDGKEANTLTVPTARGQKADLAIKDYVLDLNMPQFYFHVQTAYCILRMKGVPLGKADFVLGILGPAE